MNERLTGAESPWAFRVSDYLKFGEVQKEKKRKKWITSQVFQGDRTNIIADADAFPEFTGDAPHLIPMLNNTLKHFNVEQVQADGGYFATYNLLAIKDAGALPFIPFRENSAYRHNATKAGDVLWNQLLDFYRNHNEQFKQYYHQRSNAETVFSMVKRKYGGAVLSKNPDAQVNEVLCKFVAHNLCVLVASAYELRMPIMIGEYPKLKREPALLSSGLPTEQPAKPESSFWESIKSLAA